MLCECLIYHGLQANQYNTKKETFIKNKTSVFGLDLLPSPENRETHFECIVQVVTLYCRTPDLNFQFCKFLKNILLNKC